MVWKLKAEDVFLPLPVGCVRTIVVWKLFEFYADFVICVLLRENHSGMLGTVVSGE